jgi:hypothetical protein
MGERVPGAASDGKREAPSAPERPQQPAGGRPGADPLGGVVDPAGSVRAQWASG